MNKIKNDYYNKISEIELKKIYPIQKEDHLILMLEKDPLVPMPNHFVILELILMQNEADKR